MIFRNITFIVFLAQFLGSAQAESAKPVPGIMFELRSEVLALQPYMVSEEAFLKNSNRADIDKHLSSLVSAASHLPKMHRLKTAGFSASAVAIQDHLEFTQKVFRTGDKKFAHRMLNASLGGCASCHAQVKKRLKPLWPIDEKALKGTALEKADFWFTLRQYDKATNLYDHLIQTYGSGHASDKTLESALERKLTICVRAEQSLKKCKTELTAFYRNKSIPERTRTRIGGWLEQIERLQKMKAPDPATAKAAALEDFAKTNLKVAESESFTRLDDAHLTTFLYVSGLLYRFLNERPKDMTPGVLLWMARVNEHLSEDYFFDYTNLYLKECVKNFPASKVANQCFKEFKNRAILFSTGSAGVNMPEDLRKEIEALQKMLKSEPAAKKAKKK